MLLDTQSRRRVIIFYAAQRDEIARHVISILNSSLGVLFFLPQRRGGAHPQITLAAGSETVAERARSAPRTKNSRNSSLDLLDVLPPELNLYQDMTQAPTQKIPLMPCASVYLRQLKCLSKICTFLIAFETAN